MNALEADYEMRICVITEKMYPFVGGAETRWFEICKRLAKKHEVHVYTVWGDVTADVESWKALPENEAVEGFVIHRVCRCARARKSHLFRIGTRSIWICINYGVAVAQRLISTEFDVYDFNHFPLLHIPIVRPVVKGKAVITWHEVWGNMWRRYKGVRKIGKEMEYLVSKLKWDKHIAVSEFTAKRLRDICGVKDEDIAVIPCGVREEFFGPCKKEEGKILFVGRLTPDKHVHDLLLDSFVEAKMHDNSLSLHIVGDGPCFSLIASKAKKIKDVHLYGYISQTELVYHIKSSRLLCLPSEFEGQGLAALEAQASGTPVVTTNYPLNAVAQELIIDDFNGYVVEPTSHAIANAVLKITSEWSRLSQNSLNLAKKYSLDLVARRTEKVYKDLLEI